MRIWGWVSLSQTLNFWPPGSKWLKRRIHPHHRLQFCLLQNKTVEKQRKHHAESLNILRNTWIAIPLQGYLVLHIYLTKTETFGAVPPQLSCDLCEQLSCAVKCDSSQCRPGGCNLVMWHHGTPRPVLEIVLASVCGLALHNYLFSHCHCRTAGLLQATRPVSSKPAAEVAK